jgi:hypothetical protein
VSTWRGHKIAIKDHEWVYIDTLELVSENKDRACGKCGAENTKEGHDACLGTLHGVTNACCGHGVITDAYVMFNDHRIIRGKDVVEVRKSL